MAAGSTRPVGGDAPTTFGHSDNEQPLQVCSIALLVTTFFDGRQVTAIAGAKWYS
jgi:hypothetical protein